MDTVAFERRVAALRQCLEAERDRVAGDMLDYPTPVPACDVDFNALIDERIRLADALARLDALRAAVLDNTPMASVWNHHPHGPGASAQGMI
ncbi:MAG: hypothetical protein H7125_00380 [Proteobacteria bacterium]|nr:hypothetical protein [Burkholderiales bacterium]